MPYGGFSSPYGEAPQILTQSANTIAEILSKREQQKQETEGHQAIADYALKTGAATPEQWAEYNKAKPAKQAGMLASFVYLTKQKQEQEQQQRQQDTADRAQAAQDRIQQAYDQKQREIANARAAGPSANMQWFNGVPFQFNPETGQYTTVQSLIPQPQEQTVPVTYGGQTYNLPISSAAAQKVLMGTDKEAAAKEFDAQAKAHGVTPDVLADTSQQHSAIYNMQTGQFRNAPNTNQFSHIYYGPYLNDKDLAATMQQANPKNRPPMLSLAAAKNLNALQVAATTTPQADLTQTTTPQVPAGNIVPGISAPGGAPVTFAPGTSPQVPMGSQANGNSSAVDTALAAAARTQTSMGTAAPLPGLGASMGGAGTPFPVTAIPTTFRNVRGAGYVPRAVSVLPAGLSTADLIRAQMGLPGTAPPMLAARSGMGSQGIAPPTDEQIAMMQQQLLPSGMTGGVPIALSGTGSGSGTPILPAGTPMPRRTAARVIAQNLPSPPLGSEAASGNVPNPPSIAASTPVPAGPTPAPSPVPALPPGTKRVVNGIPAFWDGAGWLPISQSEPTPQG